VALLRRLETATANARQLGALCSSITLISANTSLAPALSPALKRRLALLLRRLIRPAKLLFCFLCSAVIHVITIVCGVWCVVCGVWCVVCGVMMVPAVEPTNYLNLTGRQEPLNRYDGMMV
jgi:hypothetical protein